MFEINNISKDQIINFICILLLVILVIVLVCCLCFNKKYEPFEDSNNICILAHKNGCPFSEKMLQKIKDNGMKIGNNKVIVIDINGDGKELAQKHGVSGTPTLLKLSNGKTGTLIGKHVGYTDDFNKVEQSLNGNDESNNNNNNNSNDNKENNNNNDNKLSEDIVNSLDNGVVVMTGDLNCPFCQRMKAYYEKNGINYKFVPSDSHNGNILMKLSGAKGVPLNSKVKNNKLEHKVGYSEDKDWFMN